jgi:AcrR family transcriptional regulator
MNGSAPTNQAADTQERLRLVDAVVAEAVEVGYAGVTVERILRRTGMARDTFYAHFDSTGAAIFATHQSRFERYIDRLLKTCRTQPTWPMKVKVGIGATLDMAAASPADARFLTETSLGTWDMPGGIPDSKDRLARLLVGGRAETPRGDDLPSLLEAVLVTGIAATIAAQLRAGEAKRLPSLAPELTELILTYYLGREEAAGLARRPRSKPQDR